MRFISQSQSYHDRVWRHNAYRDGWAPALDRHDDVGIDLFLRMVQVLFRPRRLQHRCSSCGLSEHESDAVHCKRCGALLPCEPDGSS